MQLSYHKKNIFFFLLFFVSNAMPYNVGMLIVATGKYTVFVEDLVKSARKNFLPNHKLTFFVFTDGDILQDHDIVRCSHQRVGWPYDTLVRHYASYNYKEVLKSMDYLFYCDADTVFGGVIGEEILGDLVGAQAIYHINNTEPYNIQKNSVAYVPEEKRGKYCSGSFYGGKAKEYIKMMDKVVEQIEQDWVQGFFAKHHDESYLNHYLAHYPHTKISPYCIIDCNLHPELPKKILQVEKDFSSVRKAETWKSDKLYEQWWLDCFDRCSEDMLTTFGNMSALSREYVRNHVINEEYSSVLDVGCGYYMDFFAYRSMEKNISYRGLDIVPYFVALGKTMKANIDHGSAEQMPYEDNSFDIVYARHLVEHFPSYKAVLSELVRCAKKEIVVVFSGKRPQYGGSRISPPYFVYQKNAIEKFLYNLSLEGKKIKNCFWKRIGVKEKALHIKL